MLLAMRRGYVGISSGLATIETHARDWPLASFDFEAARDLLDRPRRRDAMDALADGSHKGEGSPVMEAPNRRARATRSTGGPQRSLFQ